GRGPIWSEGLIFALAIVAVLAAFIRKGAADANTSFVRFLALYSLLLMAAYSLIAYKTPWCLLSFWHGMILLAGVGAVVLVEVARRPLARLAAGTLLLAAAFQLAAQAWATSIPYASDPRNPYVYAQTSPDLLNLVRKVQQIAQVNPQRNEM